MVEEFCRTNEKCFACGGDIGDKLPPGKIGDDEECCNHGQGHENERNVGNDEKIGKNAEDWQLTEVRNDEWCRGERGTDRHDERADDGTKMLFEAFVKAMLNDAQPKLALVKIHSPNDAENG